MSLRCMHSAGGKREPTIPKHTSNPISPLLFLAFRSRGAIYVISHTLSAKNPRVCSTDELTPGAKARATALVEAYAPIPATEGDLRCIEERQLRHKAGTSVGVSPPCRHGFPQAFAFDPCGHKVSSGLFRLSCPLLVQAIDQLEDEGGIEEVNARLSTDEELREVTCYPFGIASKIVGTK